MLNDWGTGTSLSKDSKLSNNIPKQPSWHYRGDYDHQKYDVTHLRKSHVRDTDQILPDCHKTDISQSVIKRVFPAEHPFSSHIPRKTLFPDIASLEDAKRSIEAKESESFLTEKAANPRDVLVVTKTKGHGQRHEILVPSETGGRTPLHWLRGTFDQIPKQTNQRNRYYPIPITMLTPNQQNHQAQRISQESTKILRERELQNWRTTYTHNHGVTPAPIESGRLAAASSESGIWTKVDLTGNERQSLCHNSSPKRMLSNQRCNKWSNDASTAPSHTDVIFPRIQENFNEMTSKNHPSEQKMVNPDTCTSFKKINRITNSSITLDGNVPLQKTGSHIDDFTDRNHFKSISSNYLPTDLIHSYTRDSAYRTHFPLHMHVGPHAEYRYKWKPGEGQPRPQTQLLAIQALFNKSKIRKKFRDMCPDKHPDLRKNINHGKKHYFDGVNAQEIRG